MSIVRRALALLCIAVLPSTSVTAQDLRFTLPISAALTNQPVPQASGSEFVTPHPDGITIRGAGALTFIDVEPPRLTRVVWPDAITQSGTGAQAASQPSPKPGYAKRFGTIAAGIGLTGLGAYMWSHGGSHRNADYSPSACRSALLMGSVAAQGRFCNETIPNNKKVAGLVPMIAGPFVILWGIAM